MKRISLSGALFLFGGIILGHTQQWSQTSAPEQSWVSVASSADGSRLVAAASPYDGGPIYISTNYGAAWQRSSAPSTNWVSVASSADGLKLTAAAVGGVRGEPGPIYASTNGGEMWSQISAPILVWSAVASSADGNTLVAAPRWKSIYVSTNAGVTWDATATPEQLWHSIACSADGTRLIAGTCGGYVLTSTNRGQTWQTNDLPWDCWFAVASSADGSHLAAVSPSVDYLPGHVCISTDFGSSWQTNVLAETWNAIACSTNGTRLVAGAGGFYWQQLPMIMSVDSGTNWGTIGDSLWSCRSLACSADGTRWVMAAVNGDIGSIFTMATDPAPPLATTLPVEATRTNAVLHALVNPNGTETTAWFEWGTGTNYDHVTTGVSVGSGWTNVLVSTTIAETTPLVVYHYRVVTENALGSGTGWDVPFWSPEIVLNGESIITNECHGSFDDAGAIAYDLTPDVLPVTVEGYVTTNWPGVYTLTYTATNSVGGSDSVVRTVVVEDKTPPAIYWYTNWIIDAFDERGAPLQYLAFAYDECSGIPSVTSDPPQLTVLPIGTNMVTFTATDSSGNSSSTNGGVVVLGPHGVFRDVLLQMTTRPEWLPTNAGRWMPQVISQMERIQADEVWLAETNLSSTAGGQVFRRLENVVSRLLAHERPNIPDVPNAAIREWVYRLVHASEIAAISEIDEAAQAGATPSQLDHATKTFIEGNELFREQNYFKALQKYRPAWSSAAQLVRKLNK